MVKKLAQKNCYSVFSGKISDPLFSELLLPYVLLSSFISTIHVKARSAVVGLCHINLLPKLLGSSCESEKPLLRYHFHINAAKVLVVEHLMWRRKLFLELLYHHAPVCLLAVLIFSFGRLWKIVFADKSLFFYLGLDMVSWVAMITSVFFICDYGPRHGPQAQYKR